MCVSTKHFTFNYIYSCECEHSDIEKEVYTKHIKTKSMHLSDNKTIFESYCSTCKKNCLYKYYEMEVYGVVIVYSIKMIFKTISNDLCEHYRSEKKEDQYVLSKEDIGNGKVMYLNFYPACKKLL